MGEARLKYQKWYDDPYKILAQYLVSQSTRAEIERLLRDDSFILQIMIHEVRNIDYNTPFADCIFHEHAHGEKRMDLMQHLDLLAGYFYRELDLDRLRGEISLFCEEIGIFQEEQEENV